MTDLRDAFRALGVGVIVGAGVSVWASQFVATLLYGLQPRGTGNRRQR